MDDSLDPLIEDLSSLVDEDARPAPHIIEVTGGTADAVQSELKRMFRSDPRLTAVTVSIKGKTVGPITRKSLGESLRTAGSPGDSSYEVGEGERPVLAGDSTRYRLLGFICAKDDSKAYRIFYDERDLPSCPHHGPMEFQG